MSNIKGTNVASPIVPFTTGDTYATHEAKYGKGGFRTVQTIAEICKSFGCFLELMDSIIKGHYQMS